MLLRELALRDRPGGQLLAVFDAYCGTFDGETALGAAYRLAPPAAIRAAQASVIAKGLVPPDAYRPGAPAA